MGIGYIAERGLGSGLPKCNNTYTMEFFNMAVNHSCLDVMMIFGIILTLVGTG